MPIYEYVNKKNEKIDRYFPSYKDAPDEITEDGDLYKRVVSASQRFVFVGSGFHCNDYKG